MVPHLPVQSPGTHAAHWCVAPSQTWPGAHAPQAMRLPQASPRNPQWKPMAPHASVTHRCVCGSQFAFIVGSQVPQASAPAHVESGPQPTPEIGSSSAGNLRPCPIPIRPATARGVVPLARFVGPDVAIPCGACVGTTHARIAAGGIARPVGSARHQSDRTNRKNECCPSQSASGTQNENHSPIWRKPQLPVNPKRAESTSPPFRGSPRRQDARTGTDPIPRRLRVSGDPLLWARFCPPHLFGRRRRRVQRTKVETTWYM